MKQNAGFTMVELMIAMVVFTGVMAGALSFLTAQSRGFRRGDQEMATMLNLSYGADHLHAQMRTTGSNVAFRQPLVVYASANSFSFNADYASNDPADISAVYIDPDASANETTGLRLVEQITIPGSNPAFLYPSQNYTIGCCVNTAAETITLFFQPDAETPRADDFILLRQVNGNPPEPLVRNVLPIAANQPFFRYSRLQPAAGGNPATLVAVTAAQLPLSHAVPGHGSTADAGVMIDALRSVQVDFLVTNGQLGGLERTQRIALNIPLPNMGLRELTMCGSAPVLGQALVAAYANVGGVNQVTLNWNRAFDENQGERDVVRYVLWRRDITDPGWGDQDPLTSIPAIGTAAYTHVDTDLVPGTTYEYQLAAQDCSPRLSATTTSNQVAIP